VINNGDKVDTIVYTIPTMDKPKPSAIRVIKRIASRCGDSTFSLDSRIYNQSDIGKPTEGMFYGTYRIVACKIIGVEHAIDVAKDHITASSNDLVKRCKKIQDKCDEINDFIKNMEIRVIDDTYVG
jgi:hypothetical protein